MEPIYLDHAATTPMHPAVIEAMTNEMKETIGNPSSIHRFGREAHRKIEDVRQLIATSLDAAPHEIIFNSGGTESDNTAIIETALANKEKGTHLITTAIEHPAVLKTMAYLEKKGFTVTYLPVNEQGDVTVASVKEALRDDTVLVSIMYGNNEIGNLLPIQQIGELLAEHPAVFHTDAVQAYGAEPISPHKLGIDLLSVSAHKINGPKGVGFLFKTAALSLPSLLHGGDQEEKHRAGTENVAGIVALGAAVERLTPQVKQQHQAAYSGFQDQILAQLTKAGISYKVNGNLQQKLAHILNIWFPEIPSDLLLLHLDLQGIAISTGSACTAGVVAPSHVLEAMYGTGHPAAKESVRISFGLNNTPEQIAYFTEVLIVTIQKIQ